ncbi:MAG: hypothetical protein WCR08_12135, partial [Gammaproteobacteria bacterium]
PKTHHPSTFGVLHAVWSLSMIGGSLVGSWLMGLGQALPFLLFGLLNVGSVFLALAYYGWRVGKINQISSYTESDQLN